MNEAEVYVEAFKQFGAVSAVLSGLAFATGVSLLTIAASSDRQDILDEAATFTAGSAIASAACFVVAAIGWAFLSFKGVGLAQVVTQEDQFPRLLFLQNKQASITFMIGLTLFLYSIGRSGYIGSKMLGRVTTAVAILAAGSIAWIIYINFTS